MTGLLTTSSTLSGSKPFGSPDEAQSGAASFLIRYRGRTLEPYSDDLRCCFQWAARRTANPAQHVRCPKCW